MTKEKHRIFGINIMRIVCMLLIYGRHSITMFGCSYGNRADKIIVESTGAVMTCFFMMSGFTLYYQYGNKKIMENGLIKFYAKRLLAILPSYYLVHIGWAFFHMDTISDWVALTPIEFMGIQSAYNSLFGILHNGGTWFVSCLLFSYLFYPVLQELLEDLNLNVKIGMGMIMYFLLVYSDYIVGRFGLAGNYSNPVFRIIEFSCGAVLCSVLLTDKDKEVRFGGVNAYLFPICTGVLGCLIILMKGTAFEFTKKYFYIPFIAAVLVLSFIVRNKKLEDSRLLNLLGKISYHFFLSQLFLWEISAFVLCILKKENNFSKIAVSLVCCFSMAILAYYFYDRPLQKYIISKYKLYKRGRSI